MGSSVGIGVQTTLSSGSANGEVCLGNINRNGRERKALQNAGNVLKKTVYLGVMPLNADSQHSGGPWVSTSV